MHVRRLLPDLPAAGPAYQRLAGGVRALIVDGRLPLGTRLPAERELARTLGISRTTTSAAYTLLRREGYLTSRRGAGSFASFPSEASTAGLPWLGEVDEGVIDLTVAAPTALAESFLDASAAAVEQLPRHLAGDGYRVLGLPELREAVAEQYRRRGLPTTVEQVMITSGAQGAIALAARVFVTPGAAVLVESPTYPNALDSFLASSARLVPVPVGDGWDDELVESSFRQTLPRLAYFTPDFNNPTGRLTLSVERAMLVRAARRADTLVLADESYLGLGLADGLPEVEPLAAHDPERVISIGGMSKSAWGGLRIGWVRAAPTLVQRLGAARPSMDIANPLLEQLVALLCWRISTRSSRSGAGGSRRGWTRSSTRSRRSFPSGRSRAPTAGSACGSDSTVRARRSLAPPRVRAYGPSPGLASASTERWSGSCGCRSSCLRRRSGKR